MITVPIDRQPTQCPDCGEILIVDWVLELDPVRDVVERLTTGCPTCGVPLPPPE